MNTQPIKVVSNYFKSIGVEVYTTYTNYPIITQEFRPEKGWVRTGYNKRVSRSWLRKLKKQGVTHVTLTLGNRTPDFSIAELLKEDRRPCFTGNPIGAAIKL